MFYVARVNRYHPEKHSCDVTIMESQRPLAGVYILSGSMNSTNHGYNNLVDPTPQPLDPFEQKNTEIRDTYAIVVFSKQVPLIIGFLYPEITQMHFERHNFKIDRHGSDHYITLNESADSETYHPSSSYVRFAENLDHEDLTHLDYDSSWEIKNNIEKAPGVRVHIAHRDPEHLDRPPHVFATIQCDANGNIDVTNDGYLHAVTQGYIEIEGMSTVKVIAHGDMTLTTHANLTVNSTGDTTVNTGGDAKVTVDGDANMTVSGKTTMKSYGGIDLDAPIINMETVDLSVSGVIYAADFVPN